MTSQKSSPGVYMDTGHGTGNADVPIVQSRTVCDTCKASSCDCNERIWTFWRRDPGIYDGSHWTYHGVTRSLADFTRSKLLLHHPDIRCGPVQRITDPPYRFDDIVKLEECGHAAEDPDCRCWGAWNTDDGGYANFVTISGERTTFVNRCCADKTHKFATSRYEVRRHEIVRKTYGVVDSVAPPVMARCALSWCMRELASVDVCGLKQYCSENCRHSDEKSNAVMVTFDRFVSRLPKHQSWAIAERRWAISKKDDELTRINHAWSALRHEKWQGDENVFASTGDNE